MNPYVTSPLVFGAVFRAAGRPLAAVPAGGASGVPEEIRTFLARLRLLEGVPFSHLVADAELLPAESIRFFYVDREWTDALVEGALSVGTVTTADREQLQASYGAVRAEVDGEERRVRADPASRPAPAPANTVTGFLLRSAAVSGWPALHARAYREEVADDAILPDADPRRLRLLRLERLAPAVLLGLFDGVPAVVHVEEPRQGVQFGVDLAAGAAGTGAGVPLRDAATAARLGRSVNVPFRQGAPGVVHVAQLATDIAAVPETHVLGPADPTVTSAELAMQLLQFPYRQVFGPQGGDRVVASFDDLFQPTVKVAVIRGWSGGGR